MNKFFSIFIMLFCSISLFGKETLIVGTNAEFPPFEYMEKNKIVGFDIDLINKIGEINSAIDEIIKTGYYDQLVKK
ncbi:MAG: transporter substrate-binding domain-containing protein [Cetobacterium sp.]